MRRWEFELVAIQKITPPAPEHKGIWYRYTIANHITEICGTRRGSRDEVVAFVRSSLQRLNNRHKAIGFGST